MPGRKAAVSDEPTFETLLLWWMGDQQTHADAGYFAAEREQALSRLKREKVTLYNTKWLSEAIPPEERHPSLSWNHHLKVKTLSKEDRRFWLELAAKNNLSTRQLSDQIRKGRSAN